MGQFDGFAAVAQAWKSVIDDANSVATQIKASREKPETAVDHILSTSDDQTVAQWREYDAKVAEQIKQAQARREAKRREAQEYAKALLPTNTDGFDADAAKADFVAKRQKATEIRKALAALVGEDNMQALMDEFGVVEVVSLGRNSGGTGAKGATGIRRPRLVSATVDGKPMDKPTFTAIAAQISKAHGAIDGDTVREAAFTAAGTNDLSSLPAGTQVDFTVVVGQNNVAVSVVTKGKPEKDDETEGANE